ncbi:MAG: TIGR03936 family radical SAM-associated protein [Lachnospiraceae bacterium]|nr:TIGR03936 family radical SAM-associated protein [Lachnospiraceae bacterium]
MKLRIKFTKSGVMKFIGHLDIMRYFQKAMRRADIDISYSTGFSPHQIMSFAAPLGVGLESCGEYFDIEVYSVTNASDMKDRLNAVMVDGIHVESIRMLPEDAGNAMASVAAAKYTVCFIPSYRVPFDLEHAVKVFMDKESIPVTKQTKKSIKEMDLKPYIYDMSAGNGAVSLFVDASSSGNVKPNLVMETLFKENGQALPEFVLQITRMDTYTNTGTAKEPVLVPLGDIGYDF